MTLDRVPPVVGLGVCAAIIGAGLLAAYSLHFNYDFDTLRGIIPESEAAKVKQSAVYREALTPGAIFLAQDDKGLVSLLFLLCQVESMD